MLGICIPRRNLMRFKDIAERITGFSVPIFGISWNPPEPEIDVARRVLGFLEDRRVLYNPYHLEIIDHCIQSVLEIREFLTTQIGELSPKSKLSAHLRDIRAACRKFLNDVQQNHHRSRILRPYHPGPFESEFFTALGELRASVGMHVTAIALMYGLDVEGDLESILPGLDQENA